MRFRKKPVIVEAMRYVPGKTCRELAKWMGYQHDESNCHDDAEWIVETLEGPLYAQPGDWIIKSVQGEFYPIKSDIFETTYEPLEGGEKK